MKWNAWSLFFQQVFFKNYFISFLVTTIWICFFTHNYTRRSCKNAITNRLMLCFLGSQMNNCKLPISLRMKFFRWPYYYFFSSMSVSSAVIIFIHFRVLYFQLQDKLIVSESVTSVYQLTPTIGCAMVGMIRASLTHCRYQSFIGVLSYLWETIP